MCWATVLQTGHWDEPMIQTSIIAHLHPARTDIHNNQHPNILQQICSPRNEDKKVRNWFHHFPVFFVGGFFPQNFHLLGHACGGLVGINVALMCTMIRSFQIWQYWVFENYYAIGPFKMWARSPKCTFSTFVNVLIECSYAIWDYGSVTACLHSQGALQKHWESFTQRIAQGQKISGSPLWFCQLVARKECFFFCWIYQFPEVDH